MAELLTIFLNVIAPVFLLVFTGYITGPRLGLDARTLSRYAYFILTPSFVFSVLTRTDIEVALVLRMMFYMIAVTVSCAVVALVVARLLRRSSKMTAIYVSAAVFGNVGNFGFPLIQFAFDDQPDAALGVATIYFLVVLVTSFITGVLAANWERGGGIGATVEVLKTPGVMVVPVAVFFNWSQTELPLILGRPIDLLAGALIPTMLLALGVQLASAGIPRPNWDMLIASSIRLIVSPLLAITLAGPFGLNEPGRELERNVGILQASMPVAVLVSIIATEYDMDPAFVTATVLFSTLASIFTLTTIIFVLLV
jgi:hypothetical protein